MMEAIQPGFRSVKRTIPVFGTFVRIELCSERCSSEDLLDHLMPMVAMLQNVEKQMSYHDPQSEVSKLNQAPLGEWIKTSDSFFEVLSFAEDLRIQSAGLFNVGFFDGWSGRFIELSCERKEVRKIVQGEIDLGGLLKGYAVDRAFKAVEAGYSRSDLWGSIHVEGDVFLFERNEVNLALQVSVDGGVDHRIMTLKRGAIATSVTRLEDELRLSHRNRQGDRLETSKTVSVFASSMMLADALTKVLLAAESSGEIKIAKACVSRYFAEGFYEVHATA